MQKYYNKSPYLNRKSLELQYRSLKNSGITWVHIYTPHTHHTQKILKIAWNFCDRDYIFMAQYFTFLPRKCTYFYSLWSYFLSHQTFSQYLLLLLFLKTSKPFSPCTSERNDVVMLFTWCQSYGGHYLICCLFLVSPYNQLSDV